MDNIDPSFFMHSPAAQQWQKIGVRKHHGINIPLFSLHSELSHGIGEFLDLLPVIQWCAKIGMDVIQLLPLNDTGLDTSPYGSLSAFALNPVYLRLEALPFLNDFSMLKEKLKTIPKFPRQLRVNYTLVRDVKEQFLRDYYALAREHILATPGYQAFVKRTTSWLKEYALFKALKSKFHWTRWETWPDEIRHPSETQIENLMLEFRDEIEWHSIIQYLCDVQLHHVHEYAATQHVHLMGDIPILINRDSADVWVNRSLFLMEYSAGAPPDYFSSDGQNWGFPLYNWPEHEQNGYKWWIDRLQLANRYYQIYRLDHIVGFFRIWAIPPDKIGREGFFIPTDPDLWIDHGQKILLTMLNHCSMLPIGEDLGIVPPTVRACLQALGICGTKVMRWEREWETTKAFTRVENYPLASMTTVSTHDNEPLQLWWKTNQEEARDFASFKGWEYQPTLSREHHLQILWDSHHSNSLFHINLLQEYLALIPGMTWPDPEDERINVPGIYCDKNWSYRFRPTVEEMISNPTLQHTIQNLIQ